ncbi:SDR family NAD(P)-dependent oxidoreductase [Pseudoalteromonas haloplanktis]|uniref:SDR family NAD(P)-dependent oxidoreductase n=1 Tax=Pseudoalteromonas haloplanktis TaxID=228 RepID=A0ABU1BFH9_PSEHA|nr:SDR family NAD(P)-dependent oxidoreductase [Pseudoalteromonas haloplanktis]MDQ9093253.1 SDR family NAD(P)-dependent oxidoreductase [Pseudoalteromonas haloplanktis]
MWYKIMPASYILFGASSAIAKAYIARIAENTPTANVICISRSSFALSQNTLQVTQLQSDYSRSSLQSISEHLRSHHIIPSQVIIFNGLLHYAQAMPEKKLEDIDETYFSTLQSSNALTPILCIQAILPLLDQQTPCTIAALSARVGSIDDNQLGGWYSYRASKAALNMLFKTAAIELARRAKQTRLVLFHPGTTDTELSKPFQRNVAKGKLFPPEFVAEQLYTLLQQPEQLTDIGQPAYIDWQGKHINW